MTMSTTASRRMKTPLIQRINLRMLIVAAVLGFVIGYPVYLYVDAVINGGAKHVGNAWQVNLKALGDFPFNDSTGTINNVPMKWRKLDGKRIVLQGFPYVTNYAGDSIPSFQFVYNVAHCCFGGPPLVQERVFAQVPNGGTVPNYNLEFSTITGILHVKVEKAGGKVQSVFTMDVQKIKLAS